MKKIFTLIAVALCAMSVDAQVVTVPVEFEEETSSLPAGTVLSDNDCFTATTVFNALTGSSNYEYTDGSSFEKWVQLRADKDPSVDNPNGTEKADCTPVVITAKVNATLNVYIRTGNNKTANLFDQSTFVALDKTEKFVEDGSNNRWTWTWNIEAGKTYVLTERGGTGRLSGFSYEIKGGTDGIGNVAVDKAEGGVAYNLAGQKVDDTFKGVVVKNGKKVVVK